MALKLARILTVLGLILAMGWHWVILQSVAWVSMTAAYSQALPISAALSKALDGTDPCGICKFVSEGKKEEQKQDQSKLVPKLDLFLVIHSLALYPPLDFDLLRQTSEWGLGQLESPRKPPPRVA